MQPVCEFSQNEINTMNVIFDITRVVNIESYFRQEVQECGEYFPQSIQNDTTIVLIAFKLCNITVHCIYESEAEYES